MTFNKEDLDFALSKISHGLDCMGADSFQYIYQQPHFINTCLSEIEGVIKINEGEYKYSHDGYIFIFRTPLESDYMVFKK